MNTYIYAGNSSLLVVKDNDLNSVSSIRNHYLNIDWAWVIEEDGILKFKRLLINTNETIRHTWW